VKQRRQRITEAKRPSTASNTEPEFEPGYRPALEKWASVVEEQEGETGDL
jgi:hypothetical protein